MGITEFKGDIDDIDNWEERQVDLGKLSADVTLRIQWGGGSTTLLDFTCSEAELMEGVTGVSSLDDLPVSCVSLPEPPFPGMWRFNGKIFASFFQTDVVHRITGEVDKAESYSGSEYSFKGDWTTA